MEEIFDTDIIIDHLRGVGKATALIEKVASAEIIGYVSVITEAELFAGVDVKDGEKAKQLAELLDLFKIVDVDRRIAIHAGNFKRKYNVLLPDALIASTAFVTKCRLLTRNAKDYEKIKEISIRVPY